MAREEHELVEEEIRGFGLTYDRTAIDTILHLTRCQPLIQNYVEQVVEEEE